MGGIKDGDFIVEISGIDVKWYTNQQVVNLIQAAGSCLELKIITPMDRNYLKVGNESRTSLLSYLNLSDFLTKGHSFCKQSQSTFSWEFHVFFFQQVTTFFLKKIFYAFAASSWFQ